MTDHQPLTKERFELIFNAACGDQEALNAVGRSRQYCLGYYYAVDKDVRSAVEGLRQDGCKCGYWRLTDTKKGCKHCDMIEKWFPVFAEKEEVR